MAIVTFQPKTVAAIARDVEAWKASGVPVADARARVTIPAALMHEAFKNIPDESKAVDAYVTLWLSVIHVVYTLTDSN